VTHTLSAGLSGHTQAMTVARPVRFHTRRSDVSLRLTQREYL
jgi:hypothetical protein